MIAAVVSDALIPPIGAPAEARQVVAPRWREPADASDDDADRADVGEDGQRVGRDQSRTCVGLGGDHLSQVAVREELVEHDLLSEEVADGQGADPWDADQKGQRREHVSQDLLQSHARQVEDAVGQRDQRREGYQRGADVQSEAEAVGRPCCRTLPRGLRRSTSTVPGAAMGTGNRLQRPIREW